MLLPRRSKAELVAELQSHLGAQVLISSEASDFARYQKDFSGEPSRAVPLAVVYPRTTQDVSRVLGLCNRARIPVVPQGGLTGLAGGALPVEGCVLLSFERMSQIEEIDPAAATMLVQAGVQLERVQQSAAQRGLSFPLDLGARGSCLIGGNIATNAGGNRVLRYGMTRELVLGLEVVLADGRVLSSLNKMLKNNAGYDLKHLFIGSEGTLGVITRAVLRLFPHPRTTTVAICAAENYENVLRMLDLARARLGGSLSAFEVMWKEFYTVATAQRSRSGPLRQGHEFYLLMEATGEDEQGDAQRFEALLERAYREELLVDAAIAKSEAEIAEMWSIRDASGELDRLFGRAVNFDVSIPVGLISKFVEDCRQRLRAEIADARVLVFGHIADSNIHLACRNSQDAPPKEAIERIVYGCVGDWRGSISAEHGIGTSRRRYLAQSRSVEELELMRVLKGALDPNNILNPGKVLPDR